MTQVVLQQVFQVPPVGVTFRTVGPFSMFFVGFSRFIQLTKLTRHLQCQRPTSSLLNLSEIYVMETILSSLTKKQKKIFFEILEMLIKSHSLILSAITSTIPSFPLFALNYFTYLVRQWNNKVRANFQNGVGGITYMIFQI